MDRPEPEQPRNPPDPPAPGDGPRNDGMGDQHRRPDVDGLVMGLFLIQQTVGWLIVAVIWCVLLSPFALVGWLVYRWFFGGG